MQYTVSANLRTAKGTTVARRLRRGGRVPGVVYGAGQPVMIELDRHALQLNLAHEAFYSSVLNLEIAGGTQLALLRDVQTHPVTDAVLHVDFQTVAEDAQVAVTVPIHYLDVESCPGVKLNHGIFSATVTDLQLHCLPKNLPESINISAGHLEINQSLHLDEVPPPPGVTFDALIRGENPTLAAVLPPLVEETDAKPEEEQQPSASEESSQPEDGAET